MTSKQEELEQQQEKDRKLRQQERLQLEQRQEQDQKQLGEEKKSVPVRPMKNDHAERGNNRIAKGNGSRNKLAK